MKELKIRNEILQSDVLVVGGGVGGMQAAISAAKDGTSVIIAEKADTRRSGSGNMGNDHFASYFPSIHGENFERVIAETQDTQIGANCDPLLLRTMLLRSEEIIHKWESYGIPMKPFGRYIFEGHTIPGRQHYHLKYDGRQQKPVLTKIAKEKGVIICNHIAITEILTDSSGAVIGAIGLNVSGETPEMVLFETKAVIMTAGGSDTRIFPNGTPAYMFNVTHCPANACAAAIAYRAGARLCNCDLLGRHATPRYFERAGKATWLGLIADIDGKPVGEFAQKPTREYGDPLMNIWPGVFNMRMKDASGPTYMDCTDMSDEDLEYMRYCFETEGISALTDYFEQKGISLKESMIEYGATGLRLARGGIEINSKAEGSIPGLYASGNIVGNASGGITCAAVFGDIAGENAAIYAKQREFVSIKDNPLISSCQSRYSKFLSQENGANWKEANSMLAQIMQDYLGADLKSASMMTAGLKYLRQLRSMALQEIGAENAHELMRTVEVFDIMDMGEAAFLSVMERKETRATHRRSDYKYTNPQLSGCIETITRKGDKAIVEFRKQWRR